MIRGQKPRRTKPAPPQVEAVIHLANLLPAKFRLPDLEFVDRYDPEERHLVLRRRLKELSEWADRMAAEREGRRKKPEEDLDNIQERVGKFREYVLGNIDMKESFDEQADEPGFELQAYLDWMIGALERYEGFETLRGQLKLFEQTKKLRSLPPDPESLLDPDSIPVESGVTFRVDKDQRLRLRVADYLQPFDGVELDRVGICEVCGRAFWVGRRGMVCCSHACTNIKNNRILQNKYKANPTEYKLKKIAAADNREKRKRK
jgi:hypothetical protein